MSLELSSLLLDWDGGIGGGDGVRPPGSLSDVESMAAPGAGRCWGACPGDHRGARSRLSRRGVSAAGALATMVSLVGPAAYSIQTMATSHTGAIVSAGPVTANGSFGGPRPSAPMPPPVERPLHPSGVMLVPQFLSAETAPVCRRVTVEARVASRARGPE